MRKTPALSWLVVACFSLVALTGWTASPEATRWIVKFSSKPAKNASDSPGAFIRLLQNRLDEHLRVLPGSTKAKGVRRLWIADAVAIDATAEEARNFAGLEGVESVFPVKARFLPPVAVRPGPAVRSGDAEWGVAKINAPEVWDTYKIDGSGVVVGHIDSGIDGTHPAFAGKILAFRDYTPTRRTDPFDDHGHGTHTAGTICGTGGIGVAPGARLIVARIFTGNGASNDELILQSMQWMIDPDGNPDTNDAPRLVSNSWGGDPQDGSEPDAKLFHEAVQNWVEAGILPVFAAGNSGPSGKVGSPGCFPNAWAVGSTTKYDRLSFFSSRGPSWWLGTELSKPDVSAPGSDIVSAKPGGGLTTMSGTSMACPHAAGLAALMFQADPALTVSAAREAVEATAVDLGDSGKDNKFGSGRIDALACIARLVPQTPVGNLLAGYRHALETERAWAPTSAASTLAGPMVPHLLARTRTLDAGEYADLRGRHAGDPRLAGILKHMDAVRTFDRLHD